MKKVVVILMIFVLLLVAGGAYNQAGQFLGVKSMLKRGLDFIMFIPTKAQNLLERFNILDFNVPNVFDPNIPCDLALTYEVGDELHIVYLEIVSFSDNLDTIFGWLWTISWNDDDIEEKYDKWECRIVGNSYDSKWVGETLVLYADPVSISSHYRHLWHRQEFPDGNHYEVDTTVVLPYDQYSDSTHGGR